jgi:hypothetical protein
MTPHERLEWAAHFMLAWLALSLVLITDVTRASCP